MVYQAFTPQVRALRKETDGPLALRSVELDADSSGPDIDTVLVPVGGGELIFGVALAVNLLQPGIRVIGVEPETADVVSRSLEAGSPQKMPTGSRLLQA
ncbi:pyridoxal-phosphate dependent enzyme [Streptomyces sp. NPDC002784]